MALAHPYSLTKGGQCPPFRRSNRFALRVIVRLPDVGIVDPAGGQTGGKKASSRIRNSPVLSNTFDLRYS
jgi:hypothetical protein